MAATSLRDPSALGRSQRAQGWYSNESSIGSDTVLASVFKDGKRAFLDCVGDSDADGTWVGSQASMEDVVRGVCAARKKYHDRRTSKAWKWLTLLSSRISFYGSILDVMVQHHPEYAALAWGTMKLLFVGVENHEESIHQLSKALYRFANCLPRQELKLLLYPSLQMQQAVAKLYASLIQFMVQALHWYKKSSARRAVGAIFKPFALDFQDQVTQVDELSRSVDEIANAAAQAELRAVHAIVDRNQEELGGTRQELSLALLEIKRLSDLVSFESDRVYKVASCTQALSSQLQCDIRNQSTMIRTVQLNQIMSAPFMTDIPSSGESLRYCSSFSRRQPQGVTLSQSEIEVLHRCSLDADISCLIMETSTSGDGKTLLLSLLRQIQNASKPVIWALRFADYFSRSMCLDDILRFLVLHALEINSNALTLSEYPITLPSLRSASNQADWLSILDRALAGLGEVYIILDPDLLRHAAEENTCVAADLLLALRDGVKSTRLKIIISSFGINKGYFARHSQDGSWKAIWSDDALRQRLMKRKKQHLARARRIRMSRK